MSKKIICCVCGSSVSKIPKALSLKLLGKTHPSYYCLTCLANYLDITEAELLDKAEDFKREGCTLFL